MPVGTVGSVKGVFHRDLIDEVGAQIILGNTYHLYLRPGTDILYKAGGLHRFAGWDRPILTDSGGFQVFSLTGIRKLTEEGCRFQSHIDGSRHMFTPENVIDTQRLIGADIMMAFDECPPGTAPYDYAAKSWARTSRWLERCFEQYRKTECPYGHHQSLFPIVQGCTYRDLREQSARFVQQFDADGYAIGGLAVGEPAPVMYEMIEVVNAVLPQDVMEPDFRLIGFERSRPGEYGIRLSRHQPPVDRSDVLLPEYRHYGLERTPLGTGHIFRTYHRTSVCLKGIDQMSVLLRTFVCMVGDNVRILYLPYIHLAEFRAPDAGRNRLGRIDFTRPAEDAFQ